MILFGKGNVMKAEEHAYHHNVVVARRTFVIFVSCRRIPKMPALQISQAEEDPLLLKKFEGLSFWEF